MVSREIIFVLGYARSGTSALTRVLSLCGCALPKAVFGATDLNPTGHWEPVDATNLNVEFVSRYGLMNDPSIRLQEMDIGEREKEDFIRKIQAVLADCPPAPVLVLKEYRINELMEFWLEAANREGFSAKAAIAIRHPQEVFASVIAGFYRAQESQASTTQMLPVESFNTFWLRLNLLADHHSRSLPRVFVEYSNLMKDWRAEVARISKALSIDLKADETAIDDFLTLDLYKQRYCGPVTETFGYSWITRVYAILSAAAQDRPIDLPTLDEIYHAYRVNARTFRIAMSGDRDGSVDQHVREFVDRLPIWKQNLDF